MTDLSLLTTDDVDAIIARIEEHLDINAVEQLPEIISSESTPRHAALRGVGRIELALDRKAGPRQPGLNETFGPDDAAIDFLKIDKL